ncbi:MAG: prephenate dehydratase domain-containing protein [Gemmatimonas sp.]
MNSSKADHSFVPRVGFQGTFGAFSEQAIRQRWPDGADARPHHTFSDVVTSVVERHVDFAVIPVENAIAGPVANALDALNAVGDGIVRESELQINVKLCLLAPAGATLGGLRTVHSHPMALAQCRIFFVQHPWLTPVVHEDTAGAAEDVAAWNDVTIAAIASEAAGVRHGLETIARHIEDDPANWTRFVVVTAR